MNTSPVLCMPGGQTVLKMTPVQEQVSGHNKDRQNWRLEGSEKQ